MIKRHTIDKQGHRTKNKNNSWENLEGFRYAHRGLFRQPQSASRKLTAQLEADAPLWREEADSWKSEGKRIVPENSMAAFRMAVRHGLGSELDVHLSADGRLVVLHDEKLLRMAGIDRRPEEMTWEELSKVRLLGTASKIPLLEEVLDLYTGKDALTGRLDRRLTGTQGRRLTGTQDRKLAGTQDRRPTGSPAKQDDSRLHLPLVIELKSEKNVSALCRGAMEVIDRYPKLNYCIESFDPRVVLWFRLHRPDVIRGQLTENFMKSRDAVRHWGHLMTFGMWCAAPDLITHPDFISCKFRDRKNLFILLSHRLGVRQVNWIIRSSRDLRTVEREGGLGIFEGFMPR